MRWYCAGSALSATPGARSGTNRTDRPATWTTGEPPAARSSVEWTGVKFPRGLAASQIEIDVVRASYGPGTGPPVGGRRPQAVSRRPVGAGRKAG